MKPYFAQLLISAVGVGLFVLDQITLGETVIMATLGLIASILYRIERKGGIE